jgi:ribosomal protein L29
MKRKELIKLHNDSIEELDKKLVVLSDKLVSARLNKKLERTKNTREETNLRRDIARIKTILREREILAGTKKTTPVKEIKPVKTKKVETKIKLKKTNKEDK